MSLQLRYSPGYVPHLAATPPDMDFGEVRREVKSRQPTASSKKGASNYTADDILGTSRSSTVEELRRRVNLLFIQEDWHRTINTLERLIRLEQSPDNYFLLGMCYAQSHDYYNSAGALEEAAKLRPNHFMTQFHLASAYLMQYILGGDVEALRKAIQPYKKTISLGARVELAFLGLGFVYSMLGEWRNAEKYYLRAIEVNDDPSSAYQNLAKMYLDWGERQPSRREYYYLKAAEAFEKFIQYSSDKSDGYNFLGYTYSLIGHLGEAAEAYKKAIEVDDQNLLALANLAALYLDTKKYDDARQILRHTIRIRPQTVKAYLTGKLGRPVEDVKRFRSDAYVNYGVACLESYEKQAVEGHVPGAGSDDNLLREAESSLKKAIEIDPSNANAYYDLAVLHFRRNEPEEAKAAIRQALAVNPEDEKIKAHVRSLLEEQLKQQLLKDGLLTSIKGPITDLRPYRNRQPVVIQGKPLSETIIEERR